MAKAANPKFLLGTASAAVALAAADTYVVVLALQAMMESVGLDLQHLEKGTPIISGFLLGYIAVLPLIGRLADIVERQTVLMLCLVLFVIGSAVTASAPDMTILVAGRLVQGVGGGGLVPATLALVADLWPKEKRGTSLGIVGGVQEFGSVIGPLLGAAILLVTDWRGIFWINAALGVVIAGLCWVAGAHEGARGPRRTPLWLSLVATLIGVAGLVLLVLTLLQPKALVEDLTWGAPFVQYDNGIDSVLNSAIGVWAGLALLLAVALMARSWLPVVRKVDLIGAVALGATLGCVVWTFASADPERRQVVAPAWPVLLGVAAVAFLVFLLRHRYARTPLIGRGVLRGRVVPALLVSFAVGAAMVVVVIDIPVLARLDITVTQTAAALHLLRFLIAMPIGAFLGGYLLRWLGPGIVAGAGMALAAVALFDMSFWTRNTLGDWWATLVLLAVGLGIGLAIAPVNDAALADAHDEAHGMAAALIVVARMTGMILGLSMLTGVGMNALYRATSQWETEHPGKVIDEDVVTGFIENDMLGTMFLGAAVVAALAAGVCLLLGLRRVRAPELAAIPGDAGALAAGEQADAVAPSPEADDVAEVRAERLGVAKDDDYEAEDDYGMDEGYDSDEGYDYGSGEGYDTGEGYASDRGYDSLADWFGFDGSDDADEGPAVEPETGTPTTLDAVAGRPSGSHAVEAPRFVAKRGLVFDSTPGRDPRHHDVSW